MGIGGKIKYCVAFVELHSGLIAINYAAAFGVGEQSYPVLYLNTAEGIHRRLWKSKTPTKQLIIAQI